ncbi:MAG: class I SAM-dependent methyltransferase [Anaerofustis sp.]
MSNYSGFAHYYDRYAEEFDYEQWYRYLKAVGKIEDARGKRILDLGCGTGILLCEFIQEGAEAVGVDSSADMLAEADQKLFLLHKKAELIQCDISKLSIDRTFDLIYSTCDTINYLNSGQLESLICNVAHMLGSGGRFTCDLLNRDNFSLPEETDEFQIDEVKFTFHRKIGKNTLRTQLVIADGAYVLREDHLQYFHSVETLERFAMQNGMRVVGTYRIYGFDEPDSDAEKIQIVLEKAEININ